MGYGACTDGRKMALSAKSQVFILRVVFNFSCLFDVIKTVARACSVFRHNVLLYTGLTTVSSEFLCILELID